ncbi:MAG: hypothetical protein JWS12_259 [Candidatus Saccharibacteria bacterium]|nr:hypothetical protein [Candidatus Saccharibacteria bacterium]
MDNADYEMSPDKFMSELDILAAYAQAIQQDDAYYREFDSWLMRGRQGEPPVDVNAVGELNNVLTGQGVPTPVIVVQREKAYQLIESLGQEAKND